MKHCHLGLVAWRLQVTPTLFEQKSVTGASHKMSQGSICKWWCLYLNPLTSYFSTVKWKAGMALDRPVEKRINCYLRNSSRGKQMHVGWVNDDLIYVTDMRSMWNGVASAEGFCASRNLDFWNVWRPHAFAWHAVTERICPRTTLIEPGSCGLCFKSQACISMLFSWNKSRQFKYCVIEY